MRLGLQKFDDDEDDIDPFASVLQSKKLVSEIADINRRL